MLDWVIVGISSLLIVAGIFIFITAVTGLFRFDFCMNRMHSAALGDTLGILLVLAGLMVRFGLSFASLKVLLIIIFFWFASPVSGHLITKLWHIIERHEAEEKGEKSVHYRDET